MTDILWNPDPDRIEGSPLRAYLDCVASLFTDSTRTPRSSVRWRL